MNATTISSIIVIIVSFAGMAWIIKMLYDLNEKYGKHDACIDTIKDKQKCEQHEAKITAIQEKQKCEQHEQSLWKNNEAVSDFTDIKQSIRAIEEYIMKSDEQAYEGLLRKFSPYRITITGEQLMEISGAKKCVDDNVELLVKEIENKKPSVPLDVEEYALDVIKKYRETDMFNDVKNYVYFSPDKITLKDENGDDIVLPVRIRIVLMLMSIYLRDKYFERHKEMNAEEFLKNTKK